MDERLRLAEIKNPEPKFRVSNMARMEGVEPPTAWFVARYSIQLSYMRVMYFDAEHQRERYYPYE